MDYQEAQEAETIAKHLISSAVGFEDLANFYMMVYTEEELTDLEIEDTDWVGMYVRRSIDSERGPIVQVNLDGHAEVSELVDTLCHEMGHALWELLTPAAQKIWKKEMKKEKLDPEEAFADDFMWWVRGSKTFMNNKRLFKKITGPI